MLLWAPAHASGQVRPTGRLPNAQCHAWATQPQGVETKQCSSAARKLNQTRKLAHTVTQHTAATAVHTSARWVVASPEAATSSGDVGVVIRRPADVAPHSSAADRQQRRHRAPAAEQLRAHLHSVGVRARAVNL